MRKVEAQDKWIEIADFYMDRGDYIGLDEITDDCENAFNKLDGLKVGYKC